ncbi:MAG TPA: ribose 5-phosphate isomerase B [Myxococcota bacterium]|nr:ribose 5-phosphate isomerase B [Myxococcota bacterium]HNZ03209.1 ribose 5-phosphate isomerase B [Myxococcota bacterium]HOD07999.1 ribose 5-phosphate isomerase B [Myxococcota bacterium]HPB51418.1 ribose 5-phosphate isomerase B [Myxococcota bacterium]HQP96231.1 ribose 5-phosphate isomerase B [Myxococcota bacterium]
MKIGIGSDHAGCGMKAHIVRHLTAAGHEVVDFGTNDPGVSVDYPVYAARVSREVASGNLELGVLVCGTGIGMSIAANKVDGIRAALVHDVITARMARQHNNANVVALGARLIAPEYAVELIDTFLSTQFEVRHQRRLDIISQIENGG